MDKFKEIRPIVLGIVKRDDKILVSKGYDKIKNEIFYRSIGGGIEFLENSKDALKREFKEELNIDINVGDFLGISENIFTYNGRNAHELILFYNVDISDSNYKEKYHIIDDNCETDAMWINIDKFINKELKIYPEEVFKYLK
ncbi:MAG: NUDIX domain-containing protein [Clostridium sp.]|nr:NUDIX domain-containing protein [Clostridium sp.]